jgi:hypothetical protein
MNCITLLNSNSYENLTVEKLWETIVSSLELGIKKFIPSKMSSSQNKFPWIKVTLKQLYRRRDKAYRKYKANKIRKETYLHLKHLCRIETRKAYEEYLEDILNVNVDPPEGQTTTTHSQQPNLKKLFSLLKHSKQNSTGIDTLKHNNKFHTEDTDKAVVLNNQFQSVFTSKSPLSLKSLANMKVQDMADTGKEITGKPYSPHKPMPDIEISVNGVEKLLNNLNPHKASGPDEIKPIVLKTLSKELSPIITKLFQKSLKSGSLPNIWKMANVAPIFKKGSRSDPANYRPISLTCILCKTLEHIVSSSVTKHFTVNEMFYELQHGFREKRSCQSQLLMLIDKFEKSG